MHRSRVAETRSLVEVIQCIERDPESLDRALPEELPQLLERLAFACGNEDDCIDRLMAVAQRSCAAPVLDLLRGETAIRHLLRGQVNSAALFLKDLPDHGPGPAVFRTLIEAEPGARASPPLATRQQLAWQDPAGRIVGPARSKSLVYPTSEGVQSIIG